MLDMDDVRTSLGKCDLKVVNKLSKDDDEVKADSKHPMDSRGYVYADTVRCWLPKALQ